MAIKQKLDPDDIAMLEIMEDQIWLGEFLRSTDDGEIDENLHPPEKWSYRDYQRQFLSDKTEFILYTGGRSIGKCQPRSARIYTTEGYKTIGQLIEKESFVVYTLTEDKQLEQRRAVLSYDKMSPAYTVTTESGHTVAATMIHPFLTPDGYKRLEELKIGDYVAVLTHLPHESMQQALQWHELRILGYIFLIPTFWAENNILPRYKKVAAELEVIADRMLVQWHKNRDTGEYALKRKPGPFKHPITSLQEELKIRNSMRGDGIKRIPDLLKHERLENLQVFLEAVLAQFGELSAREFALKVPTHRMAGDFQELFLRFGIETTLLQDGNSFSIKSRDYRAAYRLWTRFNIPGISVNNPQLPPSSEDATEFMRFERITNVHQSHINTDTYAIYVYDTNNYISENFLVHNSVILEDKIVYDVVNQDIQFPVTKESVLVTPNQAQMTPLLNKLIVRFSSGKILKDFLKNRVNKSDGTMQFTLNNKPMIFHFRIAGSTGERNMIGLHIPRILGDEIVIVSHVIVIFR